MPTEIKMPQLGESVVEGTIGKWLKQAGQHVEQYEPLLEVITDKVDTEVPAPAAGVVREIIVPEGTTVRVGTLLAVLDEVPATGSNGQPEPGEQQLADSTVSSPPGEQLVTHTPAAPISPIVARLAAEHHLDLSKIQGTGQGGRVSKQDVLRYLDLRRQPPAERAPAADLISAAPPAETTHEPVLDQALNAGPYPGAPTEPLSEAPPADTPAAPSRTRSPAAAPEDLPEDAELMPISPMRRAIAEHMVRSRQTVPHVTTVFEVDVSRIIAHRERHQADFERQSVKLTFTPYVVQAAVAALQAAPSVNASYGESGIIMHRRIHIGIAVALNEGLIVPVLRDADEKNLLGLARSVNDLSERARRRRLKPEETHGGTFTITNHGVSGSLFATPIINQPQAAILGVGAIQKRPVVISQDGVDAIAIRSMCYVSLTIDHRLLDGAVADQFLSVVQQFLEGYSEGG